MQLILLVIFDDAECSGRWVEGTPAESNSIKSGADEVKEFLAEVSKLAPQAEDKHFHGGNHDFYRHKNYLTKHAPNALDYITPDSLYGLKNSGYQWHDYELPPVKRLGGMFVHHGDSISKHSGESVRNDVQNHMVSIIRGHSHRAGNYFRTYPLAELEIEGYEIGHMTVPQLHTYQNVHDWQQALFISYIDNGIAHNQLIRIKDHTCFIEGKKFQT